MTLRRILSRLSALWRGFRRRLRLWGLRNERFNRQRGDDLPW